MNLTQGCQVLKVGEPVRLMANKFMLPELNLVGPGKKTKFIDSITD